MIGAHVAVYALLLVLVRLSGSTAEGPEPGQFLILYMQGIGLAAIPHVLLHEWLLPYLPASLVLPLLLLRRGRRRPFVALLLAAAAGYLAVTVVLLKHVDVEQGAYLVPLVWPIAALLVVQLRGRRRALLLATAAYTLGFVWVLGWHSSRERPDLEFGRAVHALKAVEPLQFMLGAIAEVDGVNLVDPFAGPLFVQAERVIFRDIPDPDAAQLRGWLVFRAQEAAAAGKRLVVTDSAVAWLEREFPPFAAVWNDTALLPRERLERPPIRGYVLGTGR